MSRDLAALAGRVRESVDRDGLRRTAQRALRRLASPVVGTGSLVLFVRELESDFEEAGQEGLAELAAPGAERHGYRVREALPAELEAVREGSDPGGGSASASAAGTSVSSRWTPRAP